MPLRTVYPTLKYLRAVCCRRAWIYFEERANSERPKFAELLPTLIIVSKSSTCMSLGAHKGSSSGAPCKQSRKKKSF